MSTGLLTILFIIFITVIIVCSVLLNRRKAKRNEDRNKALITWAQSVGLNFHSDINGGISSKYGYFNCFTLGENRYAYNIIDGLINNHKVCAFDYHYEIHQRDKHGQENVYHHYFSAIVVESEIFLKPLFIRPERSLDKLTEFIGFNDIDFESAEFSRTFYVKSPDKKWAYDVVNQKTMELLLSSCHFNIELNGKAIIAYRGEIILPAGYFPEAVQLLIGILDNLPNPLI